MANSINYHDYLIASLADPSEASGYLNAALDDGDIDGFLEALRNVVEAQGGMTQLSEKSSKSRNSLYKTRSETGNPYLRNTNEILQALGFHLLITPIIETHKQIKSTHFVPKNSGGERKDSSST
jgi:probable addiction module antidote protein